MNGHIIYKLSENVASTKYNMLRIYTDKSLKVKATDDYLYVAKPLTFTIEFSVSCHLRTQ